MFPTFSSFSLFSMFNSFLLSFLIVFFLFLSLSWIAFIFFVFLLPLLFPSSSFSNWNQIETITTSTSSHISKVKWYICSRILLFRFQTKKKDGGLLLGCGFDLKQKIWRSVIGFVDSISICVFFYLYLYLHQSLFLLFYRSSSNPISDVIFFYKRAGWNRNLVLMNFVWTLWSYIVVV